MNDPYCPDRLVLRRWRQLHGRDRQYPGVTCGSRSNHWDLAVETHNTNHPTPTTCARTCRQVDPRYFPRTDILWASPECTIHSVAKGRKRGRRATGSVRRGLPDAAAERSRATMWDVPRFAEVHRYQAVIVENVVDAWHWEPFRAWLMAMDSLGYDHHIVFLNSMHAQAFGPGAPQSRDRMYVVFWRKGNQRPDDRARHRPRRVCPEHGPVRARQVFKRPDARRGAATASSTYTCGRTDASASSNPHFGPPPRSSTGRCWASGSATERSRSPQDAGADPGRHREVLGPVHHRAPPRIPGPRRHRGDADDRRGGQPLRPRRARRGTRREGRPATAEPCARRPRAMRPGWRSSPSCAAADRSTARSSDPLCTVVANGNHHGLVTAYYGNGTTPGRRGAVDGHRHRAARAADAQQLIERGDGAEMTHPSTSRSAPSPRRATSRCSPPSGPRRRRRRPVPHARAPRDRRRDGLPDRVRHPRQPPRTGPPGR
jgi:DNA (cytosine-5)-methyltransferase 1